MEKPLIYVMEPNPFREEGTQTVIIHVNQTVNTSNNNCMECLETYLCISIFSRIICIPFCLAGCCFH